MKKIIIMAILSFAASISISAQNTDLQKWANKAEGSKNLSESTKTPNVVRDAGIYLEKSAKYQYAAIGCAGASATLAIVSSLIGTKKVDSDYDAEKFESDRKLRNGLYISSGVCAAAAICFQLASINYKLKAGRSLRLYSTGTGGGLAYTF